MNAEVKRRRQIYKGKVLSLELRDVALGDGRQAQQEVVVHRPSVSMVPIDNEGRVVLVRQFRSPAESELLETPAGSIDEGESVEEAAQRELQEEIGSRAGKLTVLGDFYLAPGYCTEFMRVYLAEDLTDNSLEPDEDELIELERVSLDDALARIANGEIRDAKTVAGLLLYANGNRGAGKGRR